MEDTSNMAPSFTVMENWPFESVNTPFIEPFSTMLAPARGSPFESNTFPEISTLRDWADVLAEIDVTADAKQSAPLRGKIVKAANADRKQVLLVSCRL